MHRILYTFTQGHELIVRIIEALYSSSYNMPIGEKSGLKLSKGGQQNEEYI